MTYVQYPYATLVSLGGNLTTLGDQLETDHRGVVDCAGLTGDHADIQSSISDFRDEWKTSLLELMNNIGEWGGLSSAIGKMVADFDNQVATALRPKES
ncbi:hypothetical protein ACN267_04090 [Micromonospora sp. WMMD734]|uniref:WXG100 family type VII secretion target n=1 Tax=Micromonospora humidisoli TaxID=2807622 RepID=A0ABS2JIX4_9ACTN|nr:hypothetical protein [Micromonospora humidisoli]MBM7086468.1 hypothetical protein [Micromonospora humidisoli]